MWRVRKVGFLEDECFKEEIERTLEAQELENGAGMNRGIMLNLGVNE